MYSDRIDRIRRVLSPFCLAALLAGCGQVDSLLVMGDDGGEQETLARAAEQVDKTPGGLSRVDDPVIFLESAARFAQNQREYDTAAKHWAHLASLEPDNRDYVRNLALSLRVLGRHEDAERVLLQALRETPNDIDLNEEMAKTLIASGRLRDGVVLIERLNDRPDVDRSRAARLYSAMGVAYDRAENHAKAQEMYGRALRAEPHNAMALNNLGLSYAMDGRLGSAEKALRKALVAPSAGTQVRQNLAMVLSLKGGTDEARRLAGQDLPPSLARRTVGYYGTIADRDGLWRDAATR